MTNFNKNYPLDETVFNVIKDEEKHNWIVFDLEGKLDLENAIFCKFGETVAVLLNNISPSETEKRIINKDLWDECYNEMWDFFENLKNKTNKERSGFFKKFRNVFYNFLYGIPPNIVVTNPSVIDTFTQGYTKEAHKILFVHGFPKLFEMDLEELLFNPKVKIKLKRCTRCKKYFRTSTNHKNTCEVCEKDENMKRLYKKIWALQRNVSKKLDLYLKASCGTENYNDAYKIVSMFHTNYPYYFDVIRKGKSNITPTEDYDDSIQTPEDLINWLKRLDESISKRKDENNGKTNETSERDRSDR